MIEKTKTKEKHQSNNLHEKILGEKHSELQKKIYYYKKCFFKTSDVIRNVPTQ